MSDEHGRSGFKIEDIVKDHLARVVRYAYPGFLTGGLFAINFQTEFKELLASMGLTYLVFLTFTVGAFIYVFYRFVIGEFIIFGCVHGIHRVLSRRWNVPKGMIDLVCGLGIAKFQKRDAYSYSRHLQPNRAEVQYLDYVHTELHILYITSVELLAFWCWGVGTAWQYFPKHPWFYFCSGVVILFCAVAADIRSHALEARYWRSSEKRELLMRSLKEAGFDFPGVPA